jgi:hypothetical protein
MNRFEQLIEYVINDEEHKAQELFHDIIVEKSRQIYENMMEADEEEIEEGAPSMDASDNLIDEVEMEEESDMHMEGDDDAEFDDAAEKDGEEVTRGIEDMHDEESEPATKDDIMNLEDKLDQLMAEFEDIMGGSDMGDGDGFDTDAGGDAIEMDDTSAMMGSDEDEMGMMEAVTLKAAPKPVTSEEGGVNKKSTVAANAGAKGPIGNSVKPVHAGGEMGGHHDTPAYRNTTKDMIGRVGNTPAQSTQNLKPANKPHLGQASGVNTRSPVARG